MSQPVIQVEALSKQYRLGQTRTLRERLAGMFRQEERAAESFWALRDVNFCASAGEAVGIIGQNGAGKSTILKILAQITPPTEGRITLRGRVASLLEVGTGFHPELTGRENIYLNGSILGMRRCEINNKFDEIVEFSGVESFIDTPVKRYSSGMRVRLAFAVAAHLEPEILIIDEVLAVGDAAFQKRCLGKMQDLSGAGGRTVLFVSHNMTAVQRLCKRVVWLENGKLRADGASQPIVNDYVDATLAGASHIMTDRRPVHHGGAYYSQLHILDEHNQPTAAIACGKPVTIEAHINVESSLGPVQCGLDIATVGGTRVLNVNSRLLGHEPIMLSPQRVLRWNIDELRLTPGRYVLGLRMKDAQERGFIDHEPQAAVLEVLPAAAYGGEEQITGEQGLTYMPIRLEAA